LIIPEEKIINQKPLCEYEATKLFESLSEGKLDQFTSQIYLDEHVIPFVDQGLNQLLLTVERIGEFDRYVGDLNDR